MSKEQKNGKYDVFQVQVGNTDRNIDEIVASMNGSKLPIIDIKALTKDSQHRHSQDVLLAVYVPPTTFNEEELKYKLNEYGGCMYQVVSVSKVTE